MDDSPLDPVPLGDAVAAVVERLPLPAEPRPAAPQAPPVPAHAHPFVRAVLRAFPGAVIVSVRKR